MSLKCPSSKQKNQLLKKTYFSANYHSFGKDIPMSDAERSGIVRQQRESKARDRQMAKETFPQF